MARPRSTATTIATGTNVLYARTTIAAVTTEAGDPVRAELVVGLLEVARATPGGQARALVGPVVAEARTGTGWSCAVVMLRRQGRELTRKIERLAYACEHAAKTTGTAGSVQGSEGTQTEQR